MKAWEHRLTSISIYSAVFSFAAEYVNLTTIKYFGVGFFSTLIGAHFPDYDIKIFGPGSSPDGFINVKGHRGIMHYYKFYIFIFLPLIISLFIGRLFYSYGHFFPLIIFSILCFFFGVFMHILEDAPTTAGIPVKRHNKKLYKSYSYKVGNFDSFQVMFLAVGAVIISGLCIAYNVLTKFM
ncbi:MAG: metal-dependent hydrolase [bacterium]